MQNQQWARFTEDFHTHRTADPNARVFLGITEGLGALPDPSHARAEADVARARALLTRLDTEDFGDLDFDAQLDHDLARLMLNEEVLRATATFNGKTQHQQLPDVADTVGDGIFMMLINDPREAQLRLADITARLEQVPEYVRGVLQRLDTPVARWVQMDQQKVEGLPTLFDSVANWAEEVAWSGLARLQTARQEAEAALVNYRKALGEMPTTTQLHIGPDFAAQTVAAQGIDRTPAELHAVASDFLKNTRDEINALHGKLLAKYRLSADTSVAELQEYLNKRYGVALPSGELEDILARYERERESILSFIQQRDLFPIPPVQDMCIMRTPRFMEPSIPAGAMMPPAPFRQGVRTSLVYLTLSDELVDEHTELSVPNMMIHEGIPGHHLQLATAANHPSVVRRHVSSNHHAEGWTTMLEDYMIDQGYVGDLADEVRFCAKRDICRIGARVAIDLFFMSGQRDFLDVGIDCDISDADPFVAAGNLLQAVTGFVPGRVQAELNWYSQERGYPLSYLAGNQLVWELKRDIEGAQKGKMKPVDLDRTFHRIYLESGNMPLSFLRRVMVHEGLLPGS